jgi:hypothetical protein
VALRWMNACRRSDLRRSSQLLCPCSYAFPATLTPSSSQILRRCRFRGHGRRRLSALIDPSLSNTRETISDSLMPKRSGFETKALGSELRTAWSRDSLTTHPSQRPQCGSSTKTLPKHSRLVNDISQVQSTGAARRDRFEYRRREIRAQET